MSQPEWEKTGIWRDVRGIPSALRSTLGDDHGAAAAAAAAAIGDRHVRRVIATGNGAAYYVAHALWLASLQSETRPAEVVALPVGQLVARDFVWRSSDLLLAVSSSGEFRDLIELLDDGVPCPHVALTATADSSIAAKATAVASYALDGEPAAVTHTQVFCSSLVAALRLWARCAHDDTLLEALEAAPVLAARAIARAEAWADEQAGQLELPDAAVCFGTGPAWTAALEASLLLKEVALIPAEGSETREGATSSMYALRPGHLAVSLPARETDPGLEEAEAVCAARGATVIRLPAPVPADDRLAGLTTFPAAVALSTVLALRGGSDPDQPAWQDAYYTTARVTSDGLAPT